MLKIYNSLSNQIEKFETIENNKVKMYVCGPTVYDDIHIGNARPVIFFDLVKNYLTYLGYEVTYVSNITDIDDKIINKASLEETDVKVISNRYIKAFLEVIEPITTSRPDIIPYATNYVDEMIKYIKTLIDKGSAYQVHSGVYFRINNIKDYGIISNQTVENLKQGVRINLVSDKENPLDFVLWKNTDDKYTFNSPWGEGRPGWHTECAVMIDSIFNSKIDIHGGGFDLKFPHHENERAQTIAHSDHDLSNYWMHVGRLDLDSEKMSKSLGNIIKVKDILNAYNANVFRLMMISHHYRQPINYSQELIEQYQTVYIRHQATMNKFSFKILYNGITNNNNVFKETINKFVEEMNNDFNTPNVLSLLNEQIKIINSSKNPEEQSISAYNTILEIYNVLGINLELNTFTEKDIKLFNDWNNARENKNYDLADQFRKKLIERSII